MSAPIKPPFSAETAIGAIRLALDGSKDDATRLALVWTIVEITEKTDPGDTESVRALLYAINQAGGTFEVTP